MDNKLDKLNFNYKEIENKIEGMDLKFIPLKINKVEKYITFPIFVNEFYNFIEEKNTIPSQKEFSEYYINKHKDKNCIADLTKREKRGLYARLFRAYPSYIRDIHFSKFFQDIINTGEVIYNIDLDINDGIDTLFLYNDKKYGICLYVDTKRSQNFRKNKIKYQKDGYIYIELPLDLDDCKKVGKFYLYSYKDIVKLLDVILEEQVDLAVI
ncbi:MAG: hypothetical protein ACQEQF_01810 [Bacillota bacterium]